METFRTPATLRLAFSAAALVILLSPTATLGLGEKEETSPNPSAVAEDAASTPTATPAPISREQAIARMKPYDGIHNPGVDTSTLRGKVLCGYQGWYAAEGDGTGMGWNHYAAGAKDFAKTRCIFEHWPDMSEMDADEKYPTPFKHKDGSTATLFSSANRKTVLRHFQWMKEHGIDGVFLQRFGVSVRSDREFDQRNVVTANIQAGANLHGRTWAMMYDLTDMQPGQIESVVMEDWRLLIDRMEITRDKAYQRHNGKPVVAVWGIGFNDDRPYSLDECSALVKFLRDDPKYGGNAVMVGVPSWWRTLTRDAVEDKKLHEIILAADIVSPWNVGRFNTPEEAARHAVETTGPDIVWCREHKKDYLPVIHPGFSWQNLMKLYQKEAPLDAVPRLKGAFLWRQAAEFKKVGAEMFYAAMFDENNEGTVLLKCTNDPPVGESRFLTYEGLPTDHYLWLTGQIARLARGEIPATTEMPKR